MTITVIELNYVNRASDWDFDPDRNQDWGLPARCTIDTPFFHIELQHTWSDTQSDIEYWDITDCIDLDIVGCDIAVRRAADGTRTFEPAWFIRTEYRSENLEHDLAGMKFRL